MTDHWQNKVCSVTHYPELVRGSSDKEILKAIQHTGWMIPGWGIHRYYLRLLQQEARKRGLI